MLHNNGASVVYFFIFDARQYFPQTRDAALRGSRSTILQKRVPLLTGVRSDTQRGGWAASPLGVGGCGEWKTAEVVRG